MYFSLNCGWIIEEKGTMGIEIGSSRSHCVGNWIWKEPWTCRVIMERMCLVFT